MYLFGPASASQTVTVTEGTAEDFDTLDFSSLGSGSLNRGAGQHRDRPRGGRNDGD